ncbi:hypothetical protein MMC20_001555, partial [Loxospora ochrophaea]|nr:hypothetical protein [Loxospora ochrophaea]
MAKRRRSNVSPVAGARRRNAPLPAPSNGLPPGTKQIDAADKLDNAKPGIHPNDQLTIPRAI